MRLTSLQIVHIFLVKHHISEISNKQAQQRQVFTHFCQCWPGVAIEIQHNIHQTPLENESNADYFAAYLRHQTKLFNIGVVSIST